MKIVDLLYAEPSLSARAPAAEARRLALVPPCDKLPPLDRAAVGLFGRIVAALPPGKPRIIQLVGPLTGVAPAALTDALAVVAAAETGSRVLLVDASAEMSLAAPTARTLAAVIAAGGDPRAAIVTDPAVSGLSHAPLCDTVDCLTRLGAPALRMLFETLAASYDTIMVDTGAYDAAHMAPRVCPHVAGAVLVVRAAVDRAPAVRATIAAIRQAGGSVIGTVLDTSAAAPVWPTPGWWR